MKRPARDNARTHTLSNESIQSIYNAAGELKDGTGQIFRLLFLTACRVSEIAGLSWSEADFDTKTLVIPASRMKGGREHRVPLSPVAMDILTTIKKGQRPGTRFVFPSQTQKNKSFSSIDRRKETISKIAGVENGSWVTHDIRRSVATLCARDIGTAPEMIDRILAHTPKGVTNTNYQMYQFEDERRIEMEKLSRRLAIIVSGLSVAKHA